MKIAKGLWFHTRKNGRIQYQGQVIRRHPSGNWEVQLYDFLVGDPSTRQLVDDGFFAGGSIYATDADMRDAYERDAR